MADKGICCRMEESAHIQLDYDRYFFRAVFGLLFFRIN